MKTSAILFVAAAALASAQAPPEGTNKVNCAKPNATYCLGGDIILRCDGSSVGTAGRCSDNVAGYPPLGGVAECYQSSETAGDAACQKNCVVYAQPSFTLPASQCAPSFTASASSTAAPTTLATSSAAPTAPATSSAAPTGSIVYTTIVNGTVTTTVPCTTITSVASNPGSPVTTSVASNPGTPVTSPAGPPQGSPSTPAGTGVLPPPGGNSTGPSGTNTPVGPTSTGPPTIPTNAAAANRATGALAVMGLVAAYFL